MKTIVIKHAGYGRFDMVLNGRIFLQFADAEDIGDAVAEMLNADNKFTVTYE